ncbi:MAG: alkaline phosphatase [Alphaproteobacteria bacterium]|nr:MAG: alkaline phosphatase [Alphaproteobacteria bacterium]
MLPDLSKFPSRRAVVGTIGASFGALALRGYSVLADAGAHFTHGVASGDPLSDRVMLWTRVLPGSGKAETIDVSWQVSEGADFSSIAAEGTVKTGPARDYTVKADAGGLVPGKHYYYRFQAGGVQSPVGRTRTLPAAGVDKLRFAVISCSNYPQGFFNVYKELASREVEAVLHLGDYIYEYPAGTYANKKAVDLGRQVKPANELLVLDDYRTRYGLYRSDADLQSAHAAHPFICVWDDHEVANNTWKGGAENHNDGEGDFAKRKAAAIQAYYEWLPIREAFPGQPEKINRSFDYGGLVSLIMIDTRVIGRDKQLEYETDLPMRTVPFDMRDQANPKALLGADAFADVPAEAIRHIPVPFDLRGEKPVPMTDWATISTLDPKALPQGFSYLPDAEKFVKEKLEDPSRTMMGLDQEAWLAAELEKSKAAGVPWQVIGQQVIIGKVGIPAIDDKDIDFDHSPYLSRERYHMFKMLGAMGLPFNMDFWDGYPACRDRVFTAVQQNANNAVFLAGDSHNAWGFSLKDRAGNATAIELATSSVSSPGIETYLPTPAEIVENAFLKASPELVYLDASHRGWLEMDISADKLVAQWLFVSTVLDRDYDVIEGQAAECLAGRHKLELIP